MYKAFIFLFLVAFTACNNDPHDGSGEPASSQHVDEGVQYTLYSDQFEFFIEHPPLEAGEEAEFLVHLTDLATYKACSTGHVSILIDGVSVTSGEPVSPGIFHVPFTPKKEGAFHAEFIFNNGAVSQEVEEHVHVYKDHDAIHAAETEDDGHSHEGDIVGEISFLKEQAWKSDFMVSQIVTAPFHAVISTSGEITAGLIRALSFSSSKPGRSSVMRVSAIGARMNVRTPYFFPSMARQRVKPAIPALAAP